MTHPRLEHIAAMTGLSPDARWLLTILTIHRRDNTPDHQCNPGTALLMHETGFTEYRLRKARKELKDKGKIEWVEGGTIKGGHHTSNRYTLLYIKDVAPRQEVVMEAYNKERMEEEMRKYRVAEGRKKLKAEQRAAREKQHASKTLV